MSCEKDHGIDNFKMIEINRIVDGKDGIISVAEAMRDIPFDIKRTYYIYNLKSNQSIRGKHAHKQLEQVLFCINGSFELLVDDGKRRKSLILDTPNKGVYLGKMLWHEMKGFENNCILLVLASDYYKETDYIRNYDTFLSIIKSGEKSSYS